MKRSAEERQPLLFEELRAAPSGDSPLLRDLMGFREFGNRTRFTTTRAVLENGSSVAVDTVVNEFWTSRQRTGNPLHEVSYRACFKPQLPAFFIDRLTKPGDLVHDPFLGRGTTLLEAALRGRVPVGSDINPLSRMLITPRLSPPTVAEVIARLETIDLTGDADAPEELLTFFHRETLGELAALRAYLIARDTAGALDAVDDWIRMVAVGRLTGHSPGFFSVYTLPPNQAVSVDAQRKINERRGQVPEPRDVKALIVRKSRSLLKDVSDADRQVLASVRHRAQVLVAPGKSTPQLADGSVQLVVTSPPFLDIVQYKADNWLRCWFCGIDADTVPVTMARTVESWQRAMREVFVELHRVVTPGGHVAFEVGEVRKGTVRLEEAVIPAAKGAGFAVDLVMINDQEFTKTAQCWGIANNATGTNSNRIVVLRR